MLQTAGIQLITGTGHLYFVIVLVQFYLLFPLLAWVLDRAARWHLAIVGAGLAVQLALTIALHYLRMNSLIWQDFDATREITSYGFYLVAGAVTGAHLPAVRSWVWRHRWAVGGAALAVTAGAEVFYVLTVHAGESPGDASDPFSPEFIASYLAAIALLWLAGAWWAARRRDGRLSRFVRAASDNSFGVYLSHVVFLDLLATYGRGRLDRQLPWAVVVLIAVAVTWTGASLFTVAMARTPVSRWVTGRTRRPLRGGPPPVGRGSVGRGSVVPLAVVPSANVPEAVVLPAGVPPAVVPETGVPEAGVPGGRCPGGRCPGGRCPGGRCAGS